MLHRTRTTAAFVLIVACVSLAPADPVTLDRPIRVEIYCKPVDGAAQQKYISELLAYDDDTLTIKTRSEDKILHWTDLFPANAYSVRSKLIDKRKASDWLALGRFAWSIDAKSEASTALTTAVKMDKSLKADADVILASASGAALHKSASTQSSDGQKPSAPADSSGDKPADDAPADDSSGDKSRGDNAPGTSVGGLPPSQSAKRIDRDKVVKYQKATPEEHAAAIEEARKLAKKVSEELKINFTEFQTDHFICFNDWDKREAGFLKDNLEGAYACVTRQFEIPVKENVFIGKLPVFMFARHKDFNQFASQIDNFPVPKTVAGYYVTLVDRSGQQSGGHMAMWKPDIAGNNVAEAERNWAYTLVHEFTHAFVARYRTNQRVPRWLNEGVAEVIANDKFPRDGARDWARRMAVQNANVATVFDDSKMPGGEMYPVMMTMVQTLIAHDRREFLKYFDDIKTGVEPQEALKKHFNSDYDGLVKAWKKYLTTKSK
ncbi:hypothetical protein BH09PLA1_BH09PLA1_31370 [soil metagenome]